MGPSMFEGSLPVLEQMVKFTEARHGVLAGNLANLDTPGYRAQDLSPEEFQSQLKEAFEARERPAISRAPYPYAAENVQQSSAHQQQASEIEAVGNTVKGMLRHDMNNTSLEEQVSEIAKNQAQHNLALSLMTAQFRLLRAAITERA
jgi:flagellar basal-body rod protein FlgB